MAAVRSLLKVTLALMLLVCWVTAGTGQAQVKCFGQLATIVGTTGDDALQRTAGDDVIVGLEGNDTMNGLGGNDLLSGAQG